MNFKRRCVERLRLERGFTTAPDGIISRHVTVIDVSNKSPEEQMACIAAWRQRLRLGFYGWPPHGAQLP